MGLFASAARAAIMSRDRTDWATPPGLFERYHRAHAFTLDVCALKENAKVPFYFSPGQDGLTQSWAGHRAWCNPPYGRGVRQWIEKASEADVTVLLLPARTDTAWFHDLLWQKPNVHVEFLRGRIRFQGAAACAPFPSIIVTVTKPRASVPSLNTV